MRGKEVSEMIELRNMLSNMDFKKACYDMYARVHDEIVYHVINAYNGTCLDQTLKLETLMSMSLSIFSFPFQASLTE